MSMQKNVSLALHPAETTGGFSRQQSEALYALGYTQYSQGRYDDACQSFWMLVVYDNTDSRYHRGLASCLQMTVNGCRVGFFGPFLQEACPVRHEVKQRALCR